MTDIFMMHRAAGTAEARLRFELMKTRSELTSARIELIKLNDCHDELIKQYIADAAVQREREKELAELRDVKDQLEAIERVVTEDVGPMLAITMHVIRRLNAEIKKWSAMTSAGVPAHMPIDPDMAEVFRLLESKINHHVKIVSSREEAEAIIRDATDA